MSQTLAMRLPPATLVVLVGPSGAGKSHWAAQNFRPEQIVSSDALRAAVGVSEHDQRAGTDAFEVLDLIVERRLARRLLTVVDTLGLDRGPAGPSISTWPAGTGLPPTPWSSTPRPTCAGPATAAGPGRCRPRCWPPS